MAETSRSRVTITLGRSGQVVKRTGHAVDDSFVANSHPAVGNKRSVRDRLGSSSDSATQSSSKRQRQDGSRLSLRASNSIAVMPLDKDDLRFKLRRKNVLNKNQSNDQHYDGDLRDLLSRPAHSSATNQGSRQPFPELDSTNHRFSVVRDFTEPRTGKQLLTESRNGRPYLPELTDDRQLMQVKESRHLRSESNGSGIYGHIPPRRSDALPHVDSLRSSYSPWNLDSLRRRSPGTSRGLSSPRRNEEPESRHVLRAFDEPKATSYVSKDAFEHPRHINSATYASKTVQASEPAKLRVPIHPPKPPPIGLLQKNVNSVDDHQSVDSFLHSLGLDKYAINFKAEEVDMYALRQMGDSDLKELGIPMGPRKKILLTLLSRSKRQM